MKKVHVRIRSTQRDTEGEDLVVEMETDGCYQYKRGVHYILYRETEATGMPDTQTTIKVTPQEVILIRTGRVRSRMEYRLGETERVMLELPEGKVGLQLYTHELDITLDEAGHGSVHLGYDIGVNGDWQYYIQLQIDIQEV